MCSSDLTSTFVAYPAGLSFSNLPTSFVAGDKFAVRLSAVNASGNTTPNFGKESSATDYVRVGWTKAKPTGSATVSGTFTGTGTSSSPSLSASAFSNNQGSVNLSDLLWTEVGYGDLSAALVSGVYQGVSLATSTTGSSGAVGPFVPAYFNVSVTPGCNTFTYSGQPFTTTVTAVNALGATTQNFDGSSNSSPTQAMATTLSALNGASSLGSLETTSLSASAFSQGVATLSTQRFTYTSKVTGASTLGVRAKASPQVTSESHTEGTTVLRSGRLRVSNGFGSTQQNLVLSVQAHYWNGQAWVLNDADSCTTLPASAVAVGTPTDFQGNTASWTTRASAISLLQGKGSLTLIAPSSGQSGTVFVALNLGSTSTDASCLTTHPTSTGAGLAWLRSLNGSTGTCTSTDYARDPSAKASFGVYQPESKRTIYHGEIY
mgnify:CR=1 FL=1